MGGLMARKKDADLGTALLVGTGVVVGLQILASQPNCDRGCKTVLEHLTEHVLQDMFRKLFGF